MATLTGVSYFDFSTLSEQERTKLIKQWALNELGKSAGTNRFDTIMQFARIGHESKHYDETKPMPKGNFDKLTDIIFYDEAQEEPYMLTDKEKSHVVERVVREVQQVGAVSSFIDSGRATYAIVSAIHDDAIDIGNWLTYGKHKSGKFHMDFDDVFCGSGMKCEPTGYKLGQMFPELSTTAATVVLQKDRLSDVFFRVQTAFPNLYSNTEPTGRFFDKEIEKALQSQALSDIIKGYWKLSLCGYKLELSETRNDMQCRFQYEGRNYLVYMNENTSSYPTPYISEQQENGRFEKKNMWDLPKAVAQEAEKIHEIFRFNTKQLTNIRDGILIDVDELSRQEMEKESIEDLVCV